jgi:hypothetical protein
MVRMGVVAVQFASSASKHSTPAGHLAAFRLRSMPKEEWAFQGAHSHCLPCGVTYKREVAGLCNFEPMVARASLWVVSRVWGVGFQIRASGYPLVTVMVHADRMRKRIFRDVGIKFAVAYNCGATA